jgi:3',5'-cyclic-AMP phosphodiesterase
LEEQHSSGPGRTTFDLLGQNKTQGSPSRPFRIAHISDPHISRQFYREHIVSLKALLRAIVAEGCDHIVLTGDIVSTADPDDFFLVREIFLTMNLLDSKKLTLVPGNHDVFGGPHRAVDVLSFPHHIKTIDYRRRLELFYEAFSETFQDVRPLQNDALFPFVKHVGPFDIIGLNSIPPWSLRKNPLGSNGSVDEHQVTALQKFGEDDRAADRIRVIAMHHHFSDLMDDATQSSAWKRIESRTMRLRKRRRLIKLFKSLDVRYVLHGHIHRNEIYSFDALQLANGAGAVCDDPIRFLKYNVLDSCSNTTRLTTEHLPIPYHEPAASRSFHKLSTVHQSTPVPHLSKGF